LGRYRQLTLQEAIAFQFRMVQKITEEIPGVLQLEAGDLGVVRGLGRPRATARAERAIARIFDAEAAALVRGAGTGGIRMALMSVCRPGDRIVMHRPPVYQTTDYTIDSLGLERVYVDLNDLTAVAAALADGARVLYIQTTYQNENDAYDVADLAAVARESTSKPYIVSDDNYAAFKAPHIGCQLGGHLSTFSFFKALGPEGVGCVVGSHELVERIHELNYSGGTQVQGPEAMDALRSALAVPVMTAISYQTLQEVVRRWPAEGVDGVRVGFMNIQGFNLAAQFDEPIAEAVGEAAVELGALPHPVGAESRYEIAPLFYRPSRSHLQRDPAAASRLLRLGANRAGPDQVIDLLRRAILKVRGEEGAA
jgi:hypothetical protein